MKYSNQNSIILTNIAKVALCCAAVACFSVSAQGASEPVAGQAHQGGMRGQGAMRGGPPGAQMGGQQGGMQSGGAMGRPGMNKGEGAGQNHPAGEGHRSLSEVKSEILSRIAEHEQRIQSHKACVNAAGSVDQLRACKPQRQN